MLDYSIPDWISLNINIHLACLRRRQVRFFSGYAVGKRRDPSHFPGMAREMADDLFRSLEFYRGGEKLPASAVAPVILKALHGVPPGDAFALASRDNNLVRQMRDAIGQRMAIALLDAFEVKRHPRPTQDAIRPKPKYGLVANDALAHLHRQGHLLPRYKWRHTSDLHMPDFIGMDGEVSFGRIWQDASFGYDERWQWKCLASMKRILNSPPEGRTDIARQAARDVEDYYDALKRLNEITE